MSMGCYPDGVTDADIERAMGPDEEPRTCWSCALWVRQFPCDEIGMCGAMWADPARAEPMTAGEAARRVRPDDWEACGEWEELR